MAYRIRTSIHGRRLGLGSSGNIVDEAGNGALMKNSTGAIQSSSSALTFAGTLTLSEGIASGLQTVSSSGTQLVAHGVSVLSSASATVRDFTIADPVAGVMKHIFSVSSASAITILTTSTVTVFASTQDITATGLTLGAAAGVAGEAIVLMGVTTNSTLPRWGVFSKSLAVTLNS